MGFYTPRVNDLNRSVSFQCEDARTLASVLTSDRTHPQFALAQQECPAATPPILPLTSAVTTVKQQISGLGASGTATYSTLGLTWGHRLSLRPAWRCIWGAAVHPVDDCAQRTESPRPAHRRRRQPFGTTRGRTGPSPSGLYGRQGCGH